MAEPDPLNWTAPHDRPAHPRAPGTAGTLALVFAGAFVLYWIGAAPRELTKTDEYRYITVAREFVANGDWLYCRLNGEEYTHKPPVYFWAAALCRELGFSWTTAAKLPSALGAAFATMLTFDIARRLYGRVAAWASAIALVATKEFSVLACRGNLDALLAAFTTLATYGFVRAVLCDGDARTRTRWTAIGFLGVALGILVKGPSAIVIPGAAALVALIWDDRWSRVAWWRWVLACVLLIAIPDTPGTGFGRRYLLLLAVALFVAITAFWRSRWSALATWRWALAPIALIVPAAWVLAAAAQAPSGWSYAEKLVFGHGVGHASGTVDKLQPWWFYLKSFPLGLLPWTFLVPAAVWAWVRHRTDAPHARAADRFVMAALIAPLVVMSISQAKRDLYLVPIYPAAALLIGRLAWVVSEDASRLAAAPVRRGLAAIAWVGIVVGAVLAIAGALRVAGADDSLARALLPAELPWAALVLDWAARAGGPWGAARDALPAHVPWVAIVLGLAVAGTSAGIRRARDFAATSRSFAGLVGALTLAAGLVYAPVTEATSSRREFLEKVQARIGDAYLADYGGTDFAANWVCERTVVRRLDERPDGTILPSPAQVRRAAERVLAAATGPVYFTVDRERLQAQGVPAGMVELMDDGRETPSGLVLIGRE